MAADPESKHPTSPLLARWRETAPSPGAPPREAWPVVRALREPPAEPPAAPPAEPLAEPPAEPVDVLDVQRCAPEGEAAPRDPVALLAELGEAIAAAAPPAVAAVARAALDPLRAALGAPEAERDPAALLLAFEQAEDLLEALLLSARTPPPVEG